MLEYGIRVGGRAVLPRPSSTFHFGVDLAEDFVIQEKRYAKFKPGDTSLLGVGWGLPYPRLHSVGYQGAKW